MKTNRTIEIKFWGVRGTISTPGRLTQIYGGNTPCVSIRYKNIFLIFDAGTGIRPLGIYLAKLAEKIKDLQIHIFLSHTHWDHIQGIPFFKPGYIEGIKINIYGNHSRKGTLEAILASQMNSKYFPVPLSRLKAELIVTELGNKDLYILPFKIEWQDQVKHPGGSVRYKISTDHSSIVYSTDVELDAFYPPTSASDSKLLLNYLKFIHNADLLIADGQYHRREYTLHKGWGHSSFLTAIKLSTEAGVKRLSIFHHDPQHSDHTLMLWNKKYKALAKKYKTPINITWARELKSIKLPL